MRARPRPLGTLLALACAGAAALAVAAGVAVTAAAQNDQVVVVQLRPRAGEAREATVLLRNEHGVVGSCRTENGRCEIRGVPPGQHSVVAQTDTEIETPARPVMIPPDGKISLFVAVP